MNDSDDATPAPTAEERTKCPSAACPMCNGEACALCGAGCASTGRQLEPTCEHDVIARHTEPSGAVWYDGRLWR